MKKLSCLLVIIGLSGCVSSEENKQLADINKGWDLVIRASHVYPVYPLTQDLMPGDVFLVTNNISDTSAWNGNGFLALDRQILRLHPGGYQSFYSNSWPNFFSDSMHPPAEWFTNNSWSNAPAAGFPSYSFSVNQGAASSVSLPIHGIPIGLSLMEAKRASGFVTLEDAHTYGVDEIPLRKQVYDYIHSHPDGLKQIIDRDDTNAYYLQVVSRVYTVGQVTVSLFNDSGAGGSLWGGSPKNAAIPALQAASTNAISDAAANLSNIVNAVNATVPAAFEYYHLIARGHPEIQHGVQPFRVHG